MPDSPNAPDMSNILIQRQPIPLTISGYQSMELEVNTVHVDRLTNAISILTLSKVFALCVTLVGCWSTVVASFGHLKCACDSHSLACNSKHSLVNLFFMLWALLFCWGTDTGAFLNSFHKQLWSSIMVGALVVYNFRVECTNAWLLRRTWLSLSAHNWVQKLWHAMVGYYWMKRFKSIHHQLIVLLLLLFSFWPCWRGDSHWSVSGSWPSSYWWNRRGLGVTAVLGKWIAWWWLWHTYENVLERISELILLRFGIGNYVIL